jgi:3',5'-cyclic AMP phosphodiesterase CpdA
VARDEGGNFLEASALVVEGNTDAKVVEAIAYREGLALGSDHGEWVGMAPLSWK